LTNKCRSKKGLVSRLLDNSTVLHARTMCCKSGDLAQTEVFPVSDESVVISSSNESSNIDFPKRLYSYNHYFLKA
jgi:hypothetical protein